MKLELKLVALLHFDNNRDKPSLIAEASITTVPHEIVEAIRPVVQPTDLATEVLADAALGDAARARLRGRLDGALGELRRRAHECTEFVELEATKEPT